MIGALIVLIIVGISIFIIIKFDPLDRDKRYDDPEFCKECNEYCGKIGCTGGIGAYPH